MAKWKVFECVQENGPNYWIVSNRAFKGTVRGKFASLSTAENCADKLNAAASQARKPSVN